MAAAPAPEPKRKVLVEVGLAFAIGIGVAALLYRLQFIPFVRANLSALVGATFLLLPLAVLSLARRGEAPVDLDDYGLRARPLVHGLVLALVVLALVLPLYSAGWIGAVRWACAHAPGWVPGSCVKAAHPRLAWPPDPWLLAAAQLIVVALPEELFFRGYLQTRLEAVWPPRRRLLGAPVGRAWLVAALFFGVGHFVVTLQPQMLTRCVPGLLFGWMYARTRSILAGTVVHAASNLLMEVLVRSFLL
jgi:hypothetical protein